MAGGPNDGTLLASAALFRLELRRLLSSSEFWVRVVWILFCIAFIGFSILGTSLNQDVLRPVLPVAVLLLFPARRIATRLLTAPPSTSLTLSRPVGRMVELHARVVLYAVLGLAFATGTLIVSARRAYSAAKESGHPQYATYTRGGKEVRVRSRTEEDAAAELIDFRQPVIGLADMMRAEDVGYTLSYADYSQKSCYEQWKAELEPLPGSCEMVVDEVADIVTRAHHPLFLKPNHRRCIEEWSRTSAPPDSNGQNLVDIATGKRAVAINEGARSTWVTDELGDWLASSLDSHPDSDPDCVDLVRKVRTFREVSLVSVSTVGSARRWMIDRGLADDPVACAAALNENTLGLPPHCDFKFKEPGFIATAPPALMLAWSIFAALFGWMLIGLASEASAKGRVDEAMPGVLVIGFAIAFFTLGGHAWATVAFSAGFCIAAYLLARWRWARRDFP